MRHSASTSSAARSTGFTLVELLVVIGIIAVLIGILLAALSGARAQARMLKCVTNLRSLGQGMSAYIAEFQQYPLPDTSPRDGGQVLWPVALYERLGGAGATEIWLCPERPANYGWPDFRGQPPQFGSFGGGQGFSYGFNSLGNDDGYRTTGFRGLTGVDGRGHPINLHVGRVKAPAEMIAITDATTLHDPPFVPDCLTIVPYPPVQGFGSLRLYQPTGIHRGDQLNVLFCDGHVVTMYRKEIILPAPGNHTNPIGRLWNHNNRP